MLQDNLKYNEEVKSNTCLLKELKEKLPEFFTESKFNEEGTLIEEGEFDLEKFQRALKERNINELTSGYQLEFIGKDYAKKQAGEHPTTVIVPNNDHNNLDENKKSKNLFFTGDNLEVLRHLQNNYNNSIDMIYIDPPYNTGDDGFIYPDKFEFDDETLKDMFGMNDKEFERLKSIQGTATHSAWLTFMYPRLWLAKRLLKENGVILLSIDDNEQANLTLLLNEIFGEGNKLPPFTWQNKKGGGNDSTHVAEETEVVLVYAKNINLVPKLFESYDSEYVKRYKEEDAYGRFYWDTFKRKSGKQYYPIEAPDGTILQYDEQGNEISWLRSEGRFYQDLENGEVKFVKNRAGEWNVHFKQRIPNGKKPRSILSDKGTTASGSQEILNYFSKEVFSNPKPTTLIEYFIEVFTDDKAIILDFFAGSATTADAVMKLNAAQQCDRKFILAQLNELTYSINNDGKVVPKNDSVSKNAYSLGYMSIDEISRERIKRASQKIQKEAGLTLSEKFDGGFKHYRVISSEQPMLDDLESFDIESGLFKDSSGQLNQLSESGFDDMIQPFSSKGLKVDGNASGEDTIITTWLVSDGYKMGIDVERINLNGYQVSYIDNSRLYLINPHWSSEQTKELLNLIGTNKLVVQTIVLYGYSFGLESIRELELGLKQLNSKINLVKRY